MFEAWGYTDGHKWYHLMFNLKLLWSRTFGKECSNKVLCTSVKFCVVTIITHKSRSWNCSQSAIIYCRNCDFTQSNYDVFTLSNMLTSNMMRCCLHKLTFCLSKCLGLPSWNELTPSKFHRIIFISSLIWTTRKTVNAVFTSSNEKTSLIFCNPIL